MTLNGIFQIVLYFGVLLALTKPMGAYMVRVYGGSDLWLKRALGPLERLMYRLCGIRPDDEGEMDWKAYALSMMVFNVAGVLLLYAIQRLQGLLPLNPQG